MFKQVIKSGFRQIIRKPVLPVLNMIGLAGGIAATILILLYAHVELNFDSWVTDQERLYRVEGQFLRGQGYMINTMTPLAPKMADEISEVETAVRVGNRLWTVEHGDFLNYENVTVADADFLKIFPVEFVEGNAENAFRSLNSTILSQSMAVKYFGSETALGKTFTANDIEYSVTGVFKDLPQYTDFSFDFVMPFQDQFANRPESWSNVSLRTYVRLKEGVNVEDVHAKLAAFVDQHRPFNVSSPGEMKDIFRLFLQPFGDIHLGSSGRSAGNSIGNYTTVYGFLAVAIMILAISTFNYVSLAMARAVEREKEFCIRKVSGASAKHIVTHVMTESILQTVLAALLGLLVADDLLPFFGSIVGVEYSLAEIFQTEGFIVFALSIFGLGILAGLYPAVITSRFRPVKFLSGGRSQRAEVNRFRRVLVFIQFTASISLLIGAMTINQQITHMNTLDVGYNPSNLLLVRGINRADTARAESFKDRVRNIEGIQSVTRSEVVPGDNSFSVEGFFSKHVAQDQDVGLRLVASDYDFFDTFGASIAAGRALNEQYAADQVNLRRIRTAPTDTNTRNVVINRLAATSLGYANPEAIIGEPIYMTVDSGGFMTVTVVGVVDDMQFISARTTTDPKVYFRHADIFRTLTVRFDPAREQSVVSELQTVWREMYPEIPYRQIFMEERLDGLYNRENQELTLFTIFSGLAAVLSLVGLVGLVLNSISHRTKEISIRRVHGASVRDNIKLFTWQYMKPVLVANIPAWIVAYYFLSGWLEKYPYRIDISPVYYLMGGGAIVSITILLTTALVLKAASIPPVRALQYE
ncbi:ABC transporter permease [Kordiimonas aquimaris]|uniref:ABC transporter permease n=1 Tax=Kordiimonas aquimaris TaxID=707591 RepID=UPI0021CF78CB|nr:ABC transporter permease [Kordiimonas aquimaris]